MYMDMYMHMHMYMCMPMTYDVLVARRDDRDGREPVARGAYGVSLLERLLLALVLQDVLHLSQVSRKCEVRIQ